MRFGSELRNGLVGAVVACLLLVAGAAPARSKPNVVILLADDLGWADVGHHGSPIATPAIDRIAAEGVRIERFYVAPICSPTRAALVTGRDPLKLGIAYDQIHPWYNAGLPPNTLTIATAFGQAGYQTGIIGKWHLGHTQAHQLPGAHGFDHFWGHLQTNTDYYTHAREGAHDLQENGESVYEDNAYLTRLEGIEAVRFIRRRDVTRPFFLYVPFTAPHSPMQAPEETVAKYAELPEELNRRVYAAMVDEMDQAIAAILTAIDDEQITDETIVLFFSDNGGFYPFGGNNQPLKGQKGQTFEGGIRVPAAVRWPARLTADTQLDQVVTAMDVLPTLAAAAGVAIDPEADIDGQDMWPAIADGTLVPRKQPLFFASEIPIPGLIHLAVIDGPWKLVQVVRERQTTMQVQNFLYAIEDDPNEQDDLAATHPAQVERLAGSIGRWRSQHPMAGTRGTLVPHPGWVPPKDWAEAVQPARLLQREWKNELPFGKALLDATAERGVLVDAATRDALIAAESARAAASGSEGAPGVEAESGSTDAGDDVAEPADEATPGTEPEPTGASEPAVGSGSAVESESGGAAEPTAVEGAAEAPENP